MFSNNQDHHHHYHHPHEDIGQVIFVLLIEGHSTFNSYQKDLCVHTLRPREFAWVSEMLNNQENFEPIREGKKKVFTEESYLGACVCSSAFFDPSVLYPSVHYG